MGSERPWRQRSQPPRPRATKPWYKILYVQVLIAIVLGVVVGSLWPHLATNDWIKALGDGFIKLIKMVIAPIIFCTVVSGISHIQDARKVGRGAHQHHRQGIASVFVSWWEGELDHERLHANLNRTIDPSDVETAITTGEA